MEKLKAEIFDLIVKQDDLSLEFRKIEKEKQEKLKKLKEMQNAGKN